MNEFIVSGGVLFLFGALSAKWAMELGYSQLAQIGMFFFGLFLGPLVLLHLYVETAMKVWTNKVSSEC